MVNYFLNWNLFKFLITYNYYHKLTAAFIIYTAVMRKY